MLNKNIPLSLAVIILTTSFCLGQGLKRKMADTYFTQMEYYKAAPIYDELAKTSVKKKTNDDVLIRRAAQSFGSISDYKRSEYWYSTLVDMSKANDDDMLNYIKTLLYNKNYPKAQQVING